jgi:hypothetical protein
MKGGRACTSPMYYELGFEYSVLIEPGAGHGHMMLLSPSVAFIPV